MGDVLLIGAGIVVGIVMLVYWGGRAHPVRAATTAMAGGGLTLLAASWLAGFFGITLKLNLLTVFVSLTLGLPGVGLMLAKSIFLP